MLQSTAFIPHGPYWMGEINRAVNEATFLLPIITPAFLQSEWCCHEVRIFLDREARLGREDLIFPISYLDALDMPEDECAYPDLVKLLRGRPRADFRVLQQLGAFSPGVVVRIKQLATSIYAALRGQRAFAPTQVIINVERNKPERPPIPRVFRAGDPVDSRYEAFVPRRGVLAEIEHQLTLPLGCPGLILYGRRRTGKSTMLRSLAKTEHVNAIVIPLSMQDPALFTSQAHFVRAVIAALSANLPGDLPAMRSRRPLPRLMDMLAWADRKLEAGGRRLAPALDEYEYIDDKIGERVFNSDLLTTIRESIQTHRHIIWMFAGSHSIEELPHASWTSYLVSARTIEVPMFTLAETTELLTDPLQFSQQWGPNDRNRPRFAPDMWGPNGIRRIHLETGGWPHLVQLVAETVVDLLTRNSIRSADAALQERALETAIASGDTVLRELMERESRGPGEWAYLRAFRAVDAQEPPKDEAVERSLRRRLLVENQDGRWNLRVPLMQRWLRERT